MDELFVQYKAMASEWSDEIDLAYHSYYDEIIYTSTIKINGLYRSSLISETLTSEFE